MNKRIKKKIAKKRAIAYQEEFGVDHTGIRAFIKAMIKSMSSIGERVKVKNKNSWQLAKSKKYYFK